MRQGPAVRLPVLDKLRRVPELLFGPTGNWVPWVACGLLVAVAALAVVCREEGPWLRGLREARFATLAGWVALLYLILPEFRGGYLIAQRIAPFAAMVAVTALPVPRPNRRRWVAWA